MNAQPSIIHIPLSQLRLSVRNARKTGGHDIEGLAASIAAHNLLQNLTVMASANDDGYEVIAGGRRLAAMQLLRDRGELDGEFSVPCKLIADDDVALEASTAENTLREAMHPADQFDAFRGMVDAGKSIEDVAAHFGVTPLVVKQRLKLANVNPKLVQVYREGGMQLDQLQALALTDNHEAQRQAWATKHDWERDARSLREKITQREVHSSTPIAQYVGLDAYEAAGGAVRRDLFRDDVWLQDTALIDKLALDKLETVAQAERDAGWSWVETHLSLDYAQLSEYPRLPAEGVETTLSPEQVARIAAIDARLDEIDDVDANTVSDEVAEALADERETLEQEATNIEDNAEERWPAAVMEAGGVLVSLAYTGIEIRRGRLQPGQAIAKGGEVIGTPKPSKSADQTAAKPAPATLSAAVLTTLSAHRSEAARQHVMRDPHLALAVTVDWLISAINHDWSDASVLKLSVTSVREPQKVAPDVIPATLHDGDTYGATASKIPRKDRLTWLIKQPQDALLQLFAYALAQRFDGITESDTGHKGIAALHAAIGIDMADHWTVNCDGFLTRIPKPLIVQAVTEAKGKDHAATLATIKGKDAIAAEAAKLLAGTGWLPKPLRGPGYGLGKPAATKPKPKATKNAPAKKAGTKSKAVKA